MKKKTLKRRPKSAAAKICFRDLDRLELRQWMTEHPGHSNDLDKLGLSALSLACYTFYEPVYGAGFPIRAGDVALVQWMIETQGADVNRRTTNGCVPLHYASCPLIVRALLERQADPTMCNERGETVLMSHVDGFPLECITILLADPRVVATINQGKNEESDWPGYTALHVVGQARRGDRVTVMRHLLRAGADPYAKDVDGDTPMEVLHEFASDYVGGNKKHMAVLEEGKDAQRAACLLRLRRLVVVREKEGVELKIQEEKGKGGGGSNGDGGNAIEEEAKWKRTLAFVVGLEGQQNCPIFTVVMDLLLPVWHPLRKPLGGYREVGQVGDEIKERMNQRGTSMPIW